MFSANTLHIMAWEAVEEFFRGVGGVPAPPGVLCVYGPFHYRGAYTSDSNAEFDRLLAARSASGIRDFEALTALAAAQGLELRPITRCRPTTRRSCGGAAPLRCRVPRHAALTTEEIRAAIRTISDYPKPGVMFRDITTLLGDARVFHSVVERLVEPWSPPASAASPGSRRAASSSAARSRSVSAGFVPIRKKGKLPHTTVRVAYSLEYGLDEMEMHRDAVGAGERIILVDDLIATGGTAAAAVQLLRSLGAGVLAACFIVDLPELGGSARLAKLGVPVRRSCLRGRLGLRQTN